MPQGAVRKLSVGGTRGGITPVQTIVNSMYCDTNVQCQALAASSLSTVNCQDMQLW